MTIMVIIGGMYIFFKGNLLQDKSSLEIEPFNNFNNFFKDRYILYMDNIAIIGKNKNEVENGYFDIKINMNSNILEVTFNKIFKSFDEKHNNIFFSSKYYDEIFNLISYLGFNVINEVKNKCMEEYINLRSSYGNYNLEKYSIDNVDIFTKDNMLCLKIHK